MYKIYLFEESIVFKKLWLNLDSNEKKGTKVTLAIYIVGAEPPK